MSIETLAAYGIAVIGNHCVDCAEYIQYYCERKEGNYTIHTAVDRGVLWKETVHHEAGEQV